MSLLAEDIPEHCRAAFKGKAIEAELSPRVLVAKNYSPVCGVHAAKRGSTVRRGGLEGPIARISRR